MLHDARKVLDEYGSTADDAGTAQRNARFLMTRALNKLDTELSLTQAAAMLLGNESAGSSEAFTYLDMWAAVAGAKQMLPQQPTSAAGDMLLILYNTPLLLHEGMHVRVHVHVLSWPHLFTSDLTFYLNPIHTRSIHHSISS